MIASYYRSRISLPAASQGTQSRYASYLTLRLPSEWRTSQPTGIPWVCVSYRMWTRFASTNAPDVSHCSSYPP